MKRIVYLTFYFRPDLCAGSFRNSPLVDKLAEISKKDNVQIDVYTTIPNRYSSFKQNAKPFEKIHNVNIYRIKLPSHNSGMIDQIFSFIKYFISVMTLNKNKKIDLVFASSSRLFTAYLGYRLAKKNKTKLYLDIRDIFIDSMNDVLKNFFIKKIVISILGILENKVFNYASHINLISAGFKGYFSKFKTQNLSFYTNGIDEEFITRSSINLKEENNLILYAGNIGEGQGLHKIIPQAAKKLGGKFNFLIVGDGGKKKLLIKEIQKLNVTNVKLVDPVSREKLINLYSKAKYLLIHLNDYDAFKKVLPSKIFELGTFNKLILAGVSGYAKEFIKENLTHSFIFNPCDVNSLVKFLQINANKKVTIKRNNFIKNFRRENINLKLSKSILQYL